MAKKTATPADEKFQDTDFPLFEAINAIDNKDYGYYDRLTPEQQKKFVPWMLLHYASTVKSNTALQQFHLLSTEEFANKHMFNEHITNHPKLQWMMLCAAGLGQGKQFHPWIPQIKERVSKLKDKATVKDVKEYYSKIYPKESETIHKELAEAFVKEQTRKVYLAQKFPDLKFDEIEILNGIISDNEIEQYEKDNGN
jgi:hypothetical protein